MKSDPKDPKSYPDWDKAVAYSKRVEPTLKFESDADRRDYYRKVNSNPSNLPGLVCYPPLKLQSTFSFTDAYTEKMIWQGYWKHCDECGKVINARHYEHECEILQQREAI